MTANLEGKAAIVTGASRGLGKAMSLELARAGAAVAVAARTVETGDSRFPGSISETVAQIEKEGGRAMAVRCDVTREEDVQELVAKVQERFGQVDILINNAGITTPEPVAKLTAKKWDLVIDVNLRGTFLCCKAVIPHMVERNHGHIINISSVLAQQVRFSVVYGATKAAIDRFTLGLAKELQKYQVAVNALRPDFTVTEAVTTFLKDVDTSTWQRPEMWGKYAALVAAQDARNLTGQVLDEKDLRKLFGEV